MKVVSEKRSISAVVAKTLAIIAFAGCGLILLITVWQNFAVAFEKFSTGNVALMFASVIAVLLAMFIFSKLFSELESKGNFIIAVLVILGLTLRLFYAFRIKTPINSDYLMFYNGASSIASGDKSWAQDPYFLRWPYQIPFVMFEGGLMKIYSSANFLRLVNVFFMEGIAVLVYLFAREIASKKAAIVVFGIYQIFPSAIFLSNLITNQHSSLFFLMLGVYLILKKQKFYFAIIAGVLLSIGELFRPEGIVFLGAGFCVAFVMLIQYISKREKKLLTYARNIGISILVCITFSQVVGIALNATGYTENGLKNPYPQWKFVVGLSPETSGYINEKDADIFKIEDDKERWTVTKDRIKEQFEGYKISDFLSEKTRIMWANPEDLNTSFFHLDKNAQVFSGISLEWIMNKVYAIEKGIYILSFIFGAASIAIILKKLIHKNTFLYRELFLACAFAINYIIYIFIEIQKRYRYFIMPTLLILGAVAVDYLLNEFNSNFITTREFFSKIKAKIAQEKTRDKSMNTEENKR